MALSPLQTEALLSRLKPGHRVASMGYPDMIADLDIFAKYVDVRSLDYRQDSAEICRRHGLAFRGIPDAHSVFAKLDCRLDVFDIVKERGCEILCDLNEQYAGIRGGYDFVLDVGTLEHCFNIGMAAWNMADILNVGGIIIHENPHLMGNHGFYSLQPTWYADFYGQEGFRLLDLKLVLKDGRVADPPHTKRFVFHEQEANVFAVAERTEIRSISWPVQWKYRAKEKVNE